MNAVRAIAQINPLPGLQFIMLLKKARSVISFLKEAKKILMTSGWVICTDIRLQENLFG